MKKVFDNFLPFFGLIFVASIVVAGLSWWREGSESALRYLFLSSKVYLAFGIFTFFLLTTIYYLGCYPRPMRGDFMAYLWNFGQYDVPAAFGLAIVWPISWPMTDAELCSRGDSDRLTDALGKALVHWFTIPVRLFKPG